MSTQILIVEDEHKIAHLIYDYLKADGFSCHHLDSGDLVLPWLEQHSASLILLDIMLPGVSGLALCEQIRARSQVPIIIITARVAEEDRLQGLSVGADDYICKPFSPKEVVARVKTVLRRVQHPSTTLATHLFLDAETMKADYLQKPLQLTVVEFALLSLMASKPGRIFTREEMMHHMYKDNRVVSDRTIDSHIKKLRKKIAAINPDADLIHSVYGLGYKYEEVPN